MPPINPPAVNTVSYHVTSADLINSIIIPLFTTKMFCADMESSHTYNGVTKLQAQLDDDSFVDVSSLNAIDLQTISTNGYSSDKATWLSGAPPFVKYPFQLRVIVDTPCTLGSCDVEIDYL